MVEDTDQMDHVDPETLRAQDKMDICTAVEATEWDMEVEWEWAWVWAVEWVEVWEEI